MKRGNLIFLWGLIASISGYFALNLVVKSVGDRISLISFIFSLGGALYGFIEQKKAENFRSIKEAKEGILLELEDLKQYTLSEIKEIKYDSEKNDTRHDTSLLLLNQSLDSLKIRFDHHIQEAGHTYTNEELLKVKEQIEYIKAIVNVQAKYADVHLRVLKLEKMLRSSREFREIDSEKLSEEIKEAALE